MKSLLPRCLLWMSWATSSLKDFIRAITEPGRWAPSGVVWFVVRFHQYFRPEPCGSVTSTQSSPRTAELLCEPELCEPELADDHLQRAVAAGRSAGKTVHGKRAM